MRVSANELAAYLRLPPDTGEDLETYIAAAKSKARAAGIPDYEYNAQYKMFLLALAAMLYDNRGMSFSGSYQATAEENARKLINSFVLELRYAGEDYLPAVPIEPLPVNPDAPQPPEGGTDINVPTNPDVGTDTNVGANDEVAQ